MIYPFLLRSRPFVYLVVARGGCLRWRSWPVLAGSIVLLLRLRRRTILNEWCTYVERQKTGLRHWNIRVCVLRKNFDAGWRTVLHR